MDIFVFAFHYNNKKHNILVGLGALIGFDTTSFDVDIYHQIMNQLIRIIISDYECKSNEF